MGVFGALGKLATRGATGSAGSAGALAGKAAETETGQSILKVAGFGAGGLGAEQALATAAADKAVANKDKVDSQAADKDAKDQRKRVENDLDNSGSSSSSGSGGGMLVFMILLFGGFQWLVSISGVSPALNLMLSFLLVIIAAFLMMKEVEFGKGAVIVFPVTFLLWYVFDRSFDSWQLYFFFFAVVLLMLWFWGLIGHKKNPTGEVSEGAIIGFGLVVVFFLGSGLIPYFLEVVLEDVAIDITKSAVGLAILYIPWWFYFGSFAGIRFVDSMKGSVQTLWKLSFGLSILSLMAIFILIPTVSVTNSDISFLPGLDEISEAEVSLREQTGGAKFAISSLWDRLTCVLDIGAIGQGVSADECIKNKDIEREIEQYCEDVEGFASGTSGYSQCVLEQQEKRSEAYVHGVTDETLDPITVEISETRRSDIDVYQVTSDTFLGRMAYGFNVDIKNPGEREFGFEVGCEYSHRKYRGESIVGVIEYPSNSFPVPYDMLGVDEFDKQFLCTFPEDQADDKLLEGSYDIEFFLTLVEFSSVARQERLWVDVDDPDSEVQASILADLDHDGEVFGADEFARLNFDLGADSVLEMDQKILLEAYIENIGDGEIDNIRLYDIRIGDFYSTDMDECMYGTSNDLYLGDDSRQQGVALPQCFVEPDEDLAALVNQNGGYYRSTIEAELIFDYQLSEKISTPDYELYGDEE